MSWRLDAPVRVGRMAFAAIVETELAVQSAGPALVGVGEKRPLLVLWIMDDAVCAVDINGHPYEAVEIDYLYPGAIAALRAALAKPG